jgi:hypothetical protein
MSPLAIDGLTLVERHSQQRPTGKWRRRAIWLAWLFLFLLTDFGMIQNEKILIETL